MVDQLTIEPGSFLGRGLLRVSMKAYNQVDGEFGVLGDQLVEQVGEVDQVRQRQAEEGHGDLQVVATAQIALPSSPGDLASRGAEREQANKRDKYIEKIEELGKTKEQDIREV